MDNDTTARLSLPLLEAGQAQKEMTHNEALALLDILVQPAVVAIGQSTPPAAPSLGQAWVVGSGATGAWTDHDNSIAAWTTGGWRFAAPSEGMAVWSIADAGLARWSGGVWQLAAPDASIADPTGGGVIDAEARSAVAAMLATLRHHGLIAA